MIRKTQRGIWETDARGLDLKNPRVRRWYVERKIAVGDWGALDRRAIVEFLPSLKLEPSLKKILGMYVRSSYSRPARTPHRGRKK